MAAQSAQKHLPASAEIPDRLYFRIGDVARICAVEPYVLRFGKLNSQLSSPTKGVRGNVFTAAAK